MYGYNAEDSSSIPVKVFGVDSDNWEEDTITWNNAPAKQVTPLDTVYVDDTLLYYEFDVTDFVEDEIMPSGDGIVTLVLACTEDENKMIFFNTRESSTNKNEPELVITP